MECRVQLGQSSQVRGPRLVQMRGHVSGVACSQGVQRGCGAAVEDVADPAPISCRVLPMDRGRPEWLDVRHSIQYP